MVVLVAPGLEAAERGRRTAKARVAQAGVVVVELAARGAAVPGAGEVVVQKALVLGLVRPEAAQELIVQAPADVVVAAEGI